MQQPVSNQWDGEVGQEESGLGLGEIVAMLMRHRFGIVGLGCLGVAAAAALFLFAPPNYESEAKLLVRYLVERGGVDTEMTSEIQGISHSPSVIRDEVEILTSWDLAAKVVEVMGPETILPPGSKIINAAEATKVLKKAVSVTASRESNVIRVALQNSDPILASRVLKEFITQYFDMHLAIHRSTAAHQFVVEQKEQVQGRLKEIDLELKQLRADGGIINVNESMGKLEGRRASVRGDLLSAKAERAGQMARIRALEAVLSGKPVEGIGEDEGPQPSEAQTATYMNLVERLVQVRKRSTDLRSKFTNDNPLVQQNQAEIDVLESQRRALAVEYPSLLAKTAKEEAERKTIDLDDEHATLAQMEARIAILETDLADVVAQEDSLPEIVAKVRTLERAREAEEQKFRYYAESLDKARIDGALDSSMMPNISVVQAASPPQPAANSLLLKIMLVLAGGGFGAGIGFALLMELVVDRRVKSPSEIESRFQLPLLLSIPFLGGGKGKTKSANHRDDDDDSSIHGGGGDGADTCEVADAAFQPYAGALHTRLYYAFRERAIEETPRLIGCTSLGNGAGTSLLARSLADVSERSGEKVILVDLGAAPGNAHSFEKAEETLSRRGFGSPSFEHKEEGSKRGSGKEARILTLGRFKAFLHRLEESDYKTVIFDMPVMSPTSSSFVAAGFLHQVILVLDPKTAQRDQLKQTSDDLAAVEAPLAVVFNKFDESPQGEGGSKPPRKPRKTGIFERLCQPLRILVPAR